MTPKWNESIKNSGQAKTNYNQSKMIARRQTVYLLNLRKWNKIWLHTYTTTVWQIPKIGRGTTMVKCEKWTIRYVHTPISTFNTFDSDFGLNVISLSFYLTIIVIVVLNRKCPPWHVMWWNVSSQVAYTCDSGVQCTSRPPVQIQQSK